MPKFSIPPKGHRQAQVMTSVIVLIIVSVLVAIFAKAMIGLVIFLLGAIFGAGASFASSSSIDEE